MRCEERQMLLEDHAAGALDAPAARDLTAHLAICEGCAAALGHIRHEGELYAWYEDDIWDEGDIQISPAFWAGVNARITEEKATRQAHPFARMREWLRTPAYLKPALTFAGLLLVALASVWALFINPRQTRTGVEVATENTRPEESRGVGVVVPQQGSEAPGSTITGQTTGGQSESTGVTNEARAEVRRRARRASAASPANPSIGDGLAELKPDTVEPAGFDEVAAAFVNGVEGTRAGAPENDGGRDSETVKHFGQAQNLLRSFRHANPTTADEFAYEKQLSRRLLQRNVLLRLGAESKGDLPLEQALSKIEPVLLDITHLPNQPSPDELRPIRERIERGELIAALQMYQTQPR